MSTSTQTPTTNDLANKANAAATQAVESTAYTATRAQQEAHSLQAQGQHHKGSTEEAFNKLERDLEQTTESAVEEGKEDVEQATATYLQQALHIADYGFSTAESYLNMGKEKLAGPPAAHDKPATGFTATLASTGLAALDATHRGISMAHQTLHDKAGQFPHAHNTSEPAHPVTVPSKPVGEAVKDNVAAAQATAQPHIDNAKATAQPYMDRAAATAQPHVDAAKPYVASAQDAAKPYVDAGAAQVNTAATGLRQQVDAATTAVQGKVDEMKASDKPVSTQLSEAASSTATSAQEAMSNAATQAQGVLNSTTSKTQEPVGNTLAPAPTSAQPRIDSAAASAPVPEVAKEGDTKTL
ncbi:hypothetical protein FRC04_007795 [Tulasnella sp. 424]|nr:hypothetical protein FRC04_007795 [Tulasnella sp. 424]KAG8975271.1 hypothetical protein FRC05_006214 [Tulasnella sp. 425]